MMMVGAKYSLCEALEPLGKLDSSVLYSWRPELAVRRL